MINHTVLTGKHNCRIIQSSGWDKAYTRPAKGSDLELINWQKWAEGHIVLDKLKGYVTARAIAYDAKGFNDAVAKGYIKMLLDFMNIVKNKGNEAIYKMVVAHEHKFMAILPYKANVMNIYVPEIIAFCKGKLNELKN